MKPNTDFSWLWTKHHILHQLEQGAIVELSPCSKGGQGEGEAAVIAHQPASQGVKLGTTESIDRQESLDVLVLGGY